MAFYILQLGCFNWRRQSEEAAVGLRVLYSQMLNYFLGLGLENVSKSCEMCILIADSERRFLLIRRTSARVWRTDARPHRNTETWADGGSAEGGSCRGQCGDVRDQGTYTTSPRVCVCVCEMVDKKSHILSLFYAFNTSHLHMLSSEQNPNQESWNDLHQDVVRLPLLINSVPAILVNSWFLTHTMYTWIARIRKKIKK